MIIVPPVGVVDFSVDRLSGAQLQAAGAAGVIRYACQGRPEVNITAAEYEDFAAHGLQVGITCEEGNTFMTGGYDAGAYNAEAAQQVTRNAGMPDGVTFFAVDFPADQSYIGALEQTVNGCASAVGIDNVGIYGSADVCDWLAENTGVTAYWQPVAWSYGRVSSHAGLLQDRIWTEGTPYKLDGANVDFSTVLGNWFPRNGDDVTPQDIAAIVAALKPVISTEVANGVKAELTMLMGTRQQPKGVDPKTVTTLAAIADGQYVAYHGIAGDPTHPGFVSQVAAVQAVQERVANLSTSGQPVDPQLAAAIEDLTAALQGGLSWTITTATPKAAQ